MERFLCVCACVRVCVTNFQSDPYLLCFKQGWAILGFDKLYYTNTIPDKTITILYYTYTNTIPTFWSGFQACNEYILHGKNPLKMKRGSKLFHFIFNIS